MKAMRYLRWAAEVTDFVNGLTGAQTRLFRDLSGSFGQLTWLTTFADAAGIDDSQAAMAASPDYLDLVDKGGAYFIEGNKPKAKEAYEAFLEKQPSGDEADQVRTILQTQF